MENYDFSGWATKANLKCSDGRTIMKDAFKQNDGQTVPLVWNHKHNDPNEVLGHALLENREEGVYAYCKFNDTESGKTAKLLVQHGDVNALSIYANQLKQNMSNVHHGNIREVSLVLAGANPGAYIDSIAMAHGDGNDVETDEEAIIYTGETLSLSHAEESTPKEEPKKEADKMADEKEKTDGEETIKDIIDTMTEKQKTAMYAVVGAALEEAGVDSDENNKGGESMKHNIFENDEMTQGSYLSHADEENILTIAKSNSCGSLKAALEIYSDQNDSLKHGIDDLESLFPEYKDLKPGAPELLTEDQGWISTVLTKTSKSPISRVRTRIADARDGNIRAFGYGQKGSLKKDTGNIKLIRRTTDPQTIYIKDSLHRDDITDITDFDVVQYIYKLMRMGLNQELATAILIGDGRDDGDEMKIDETHIRSIWHDDDLYTIHQDIDLAKAKAELQGSNTSANFGENYIYAEAIITAALYSREKYKGSGNLDFFCTPHLLNVMLLARDLNGRRIYESKNDLAAALNVNNIFTVEQFEGKTRKTEENETKKLLGLFVNLSDYQIGATKGGQITSFNQFDIDFNQEKYLIETRCSGALVRCYSAIALEEDVTSAG